MKKNYKTPKAETAQLNGKNVILKDINLGGGSGGGAIGGGTAKEINADVDVDNDFWSTGK